MVYSIMVRIDAEHYASEWHALSRVTNDTHIDALEFRDEHNKTFWYIDAPSDRQIAFARSLLHVSQVYTAATAWRQAIVETNGVAAAENALMAALEGRTLKTKDVLQ